MTTELNWGVQTFCQEIGEAACYALQLMRVAELRTGKSFRVLESLQSLIDAGYIYYNKNNQNDNDNFFVKNPEACVTYLTGQKCIVRHDAADYKAGPNEYVIERWDRKTTKGAYSHFTSASWDSLADSQTVKYGTKVSTRVVKFV